MHPKFLLDENVSDIYLDAILRFNRNAPFPIEVRHVGDSVELPKGISDPELLLWAERHDYILVSHDKKTLRHHLADHLAKGHHSPGLFLFSLGAPVQDIIELLAVAAQSDDHLEWQDLIQFLT